MTGGTEALSEEFLTGLELLDMRDPAHPEASGLVFADRPPADNYQCIALEKARKYDVDAVYFRRFDTGKPPLAQVYIYDFTRKEQDEDEIGELHRRLWNSGQVPLFFIFTRTEIKIFNCLKSPEIERETGKIISTPLEIIKLAAKINMELKAREKKLKEFSAKKFDNGSFWETSRYKEKFKLSDSSYETLLKHLKEIRNKIIEEGILEKPVVQKLLVMSILLKYLEEREDRKGNTVFPPGFFSRFAPGAEKFTDVLKKKGACLDLFDYLSDHFNGEIFEWPDNKEKAGLSQTDLTPFARFFEARTETTGQLTFWPLYSFNDLPIELISNIYEEFLEKGKEKGVVYTPPYLVHFLIDEAMPLDAPTADCKVLDPACGSGVFLVAAYRRIIDRWRVKNDWQTPDLDTLKKFLRDNIFGADIAPEAVRLTIFSLSLVLLDELSPKEIWENLKFDNLKSLGNLFEQDFFQLVFEQKLEDKFDLVMGNPPFVEDFTTSFAREIETKQREKRVKIPGNQLALLFLEQSMTVCKPGGLLCLILPSGPFLYNYGSFEFRKYFLQTCNVKQILDFTFLREILFGSANAATAAVFARKEEPVSKHILHATFRRTKLSKEKIYLEIDHYDLHRVPYEDALNIPLTWKSTLLGGGRLHHLIERLSKLRQFGDYIKEKVKKDGWVWAEGFIIGNKNEITRLKEYTAKENNLSPGQAEDLKRLQKIYKRADYLTGKKTLPTDALTGNGIDEAQIHILEEEFFIRNRKRNKLIFKGPHVLIKEGARNSIPIAFRDEDLSFKHQIIGIHAPPTNRQELLDIEDRIKGNKVCLFCACAFSRQHLISRGTAILKGDITSIPFPENMQDLEISWLEEILMDDVLNYMTDFRENGERSRILQPVGTNHLRQFGEVYCKLLNSIYEKFKPCEPIKTNSYICFPFYYGEEEPQIHSGNLDEFERYLDRLIPDEAGQNIRVIRVLRLYDNNIVYLIKPKQVKYWLRSIAIRDADETFEDLVKQGY